MKKELQIKFISDPNVSVEEADKILFEIFDLLLSGFNQDEISKNR